MVGSDGKVLKVFKSTVEAAAYLKVWTSSISWRCNQTHVNIRPWTRLAKYNLRYAKPHLSRLEEK